MNGYGRILVFLCLADLIATIILISLFGAKEANPILEFYYSSAGLAGLVTAKIWMNGLGIVLIEIAVVDNKKREGIYKGLAAFYVCVYSFLILVGN